MERQRREKRYVLPDEPTIIVHPNWAAKNGKFDCSVMSLSVLLDYRVEDNKEHSFEVRQQSHTQTLTLSEDIQDTHTKSQDTQ